MAKFGVTGKLKIGDTIIVDNPLRKIECDVVKIEGNKATTKFRIFHTDIYHNRHVFEYGKRISSIYNNNYTVNQQTISPI